MERKPEGKLCEILYLKQGMIKITWNYFPKQSKEKFKMLIRITNAAAIQTMMPVIMSWRALQQFQLLYVAPPLDNIKKELHGYDRRMGECIKTRLQNQPEAKKIYIATTVGKIFN